MFLVNVFFKGIFVCSQIGWKHGFYFIYYLFLGQVPQESPLMRILNIN
jgi:hypothetical protein